MFSGMTFNSLIEYLRVSEDFISDTEKLREYSEIIGGYYYQMYETSGQELYYRTSQNVSNCNDYWFFDHHRNFKVMDLTHINLCHNRFCPNCAKRRQATFLYEFTPHIQKLSESCDFFHLTLSVPNVSAPELQDAVNNLLESFSRLMRLFFGTQSTKRLGLNFSDFGCKAAARSLEITYDLYRWKKAKEYHPHIHCILALDKVRVKALSDYLLKEKHINKFSFKRVDGKNILTTVFSDFEVFIQKLWKLLYDNISAKNKKQREYDKQARQVKYRFEKIFGDNELNLSEAVNSGLLSVKDAICGKKPPKVKSKYISAKDISELSLGYSCTCKQIDPNEYYEVFKYVCKVTDEQNKVMSFNQFRTLFYALKGKKSFEGYGEWHGVKSERNDDTMNAMYNAFKRELNKDKPLSISVNISDVLDIAARNETTIISRKNIQKYLESLGDYGSDPNIQKLVAAYCKEKQISEERFRKYAYSHRTELKENPKLKERLRCEKEYRENMLSLEREYDKQYSSAKSELLTVQIDFDDIGL